MMVKFYDPKEGDSLCFGPLELKLFRNCILHLFVKNARIIFEKKKSKLLIVFFCLVTAFVSYDKKFLSNNSLAFVPYHLSFCHDLHGSLAFVP